MNTKLIDELTRRLSQALPEGTEAFQQDVEKNIRAALQGTFRKMDLVTRDEFDRILNDYFTRFDRDEDGTVTRAEMIERLHRYDGKARARPKQGFSQSRRKRRGY